MQDAQTTIKQLKDIIIKLAQERDWGQFHSPKNLAMNIAVEASELMELFIWCTTQESDDEVEKNRKEIEQELSDIFIGICLFANRTNIDIAFAVQNKIKIIEERYPIHLAKGKSTKYTKLKE